MQGYDKLHRRRMMEAHFNSFRKNIVGIDAEIETPFGMKPLVYADWIASGRLYRPIENRILNEIGPLVANTHSESSTTGRLMTEAYHWSHEYIKKAVGANEQDAIITAGSGMTTVINKLQRILGLKVPEPLHNLFFQNGLPKKRIRGDGGKQAQRPVVFITHMEHHSNHTSWLETIADVIVIPPDDLLQVDYAAFEQLLHEYRDRPLKIGSFTAGSNVTGIIPDFHRLSAMVHKAGGYAFIDYAASAPYIEIDMHRDDESYFDAVFFSPHKFLGGPGSPGVLVFNRALDKNKIPDHPGGGTVAWTNRWGERSYLTDVEAREDGGTPGFLQSMKAAMAFQLKSELGVQQIEKREEELIRKAYTRIESLAGYRVLSPDLGQRRIGVISFYHEKINHNLLVRLLNDIYGIQVRGGCSCAGTYGHYLLAVSREESSRISRMIDSGDLTEKPGWIRLSLHPTMTDDELNYILDAIEELGIEALNHKKEYRFNAANGEWEHTSWKEPDRIGDFFRSLL
jgi:selenocysteine lyase/cysteine desulfurase